MKLVVTQENLNHALNVVGRVASAKTTLPVLNNILLKTDNNRLLLAATNLEVAITEHIGAKVSQEGAITVPARLFAEFISNLPKTHVELKLDGTKLRIKADKFVSTINGMDAAEFPALPELESSTQLSHSAADFKRAVSQTALTASKDDTRPVLTGVLLHSFEGKLYLAATDGYRLSEKVLGDSSADIYALIPATALSDVVRVMPDDLDKLDILLDESQVKFRIGEIELTSRLIDGKLPDYRQLIPQKTDNVAKLSTDEFSRITKIASLFARESGGSVTIKTNPDDGTVSIDSIASQQGESSSAASADVTGEGQITLNSRYLIEALGCIDDGNLSFGFSGKLAPSVLKPANSDDYQHIIMPLKS